MTKIGGSDAGPVGQGPAGSFSDKDLLSGRQASARREGRDGNVDGQRSRDLKSDPLAAASTFSAMFARSVRNARSHGEDGDPGDRQDDAANSGMLLATATWKDAASLLNPAPAPSSISTTSSEPVLADLLDRIEKSIRWELTTSGDGSAKIKLDLGGMIEGLKGLTVSMTATTLEVTLVRTADDNPADLTQAAQVLADQLQQRFGKRLVRVFAAADGKDLGSDEIEAMGGMEAISRILRHVTNES